MFPPGKTGERGLLCFSKVYLCKFRRTSFSPTFWFKASPFEGHNKWNTYTHTMYHALTECLMLLQELEIGRCIQFEESILGPPPSRMIPQSGNTYQISYTTSLFYEKDWCLYIWQHRTNRRIMSLETIQPCEEVRQEEIGTGYQNGEESMSHELQPIGKAYHPLFGGR